MPAREIFVEPGRFEDRSGPGESDFPVSLDFDAIDPGAAAVWPDEAEQDSHRRAFPRAIVTEQPEDLTRRDVE